MGSRTNICCCVGGFQKQRLIDTMLQANKTLSSQVAEMENERKSLKTTILARDRTIRTNKQDNEQLRRQIDELKAIIEQQKIQLANW